MGIAEILYFLDLKINGRRQWCSRGGTEIVCDEFVVNLTCPVPRREKKLVFNLNAVGILKASKYWLNDDCTHSYSADLLGGKPVYRHRHISAVQKVC